MALEHRPVWDFIITYQGTDYPLDLNGLTKREEILCRRKTGLDRQEFIRGFLEDDPEATLFGVWLALQRADVDVALDDVDVPSFGDWVRLADDDAATVWLREQADAAADEVDPTPAAEAETN